MLMKVVKPVVNAIGRLESNNFILADIFKELTCIYYQLALLQVPIDGFREHTLAVVNKLNENEVICALLELAKAWNFSKRDTSLLFKELISSYDRPHSTGCKWLYSSLGLVKSKIRNKITSDNLSIIGQLKNELKKKVPTKAKQHKTISDSLINNDISLDDEFNNKADQLARYHQTAPYLLFDSQNIYNYNFTLSVDNFSIELPIRHCVKTICHAHILALWSSQNRFQQWLPISQYINWNATWLYINNNQKISNYSHSFHSSTLKSFRIKILLDDLSAPHILHRRNPSYPNTCHLCQQASEPLHWIICPTSEPLFQLIKDFLAHILSPNKLEITNLAAENLYTQIMNLNSFQIHQLPNQPSLLSTLSGLISLDIISTLYELTTSSKSACSLTISLLLHINQQIYTNIWIPYCISRSQNQALYSQASSSLSSTFSISNSSKNIQDSYNHIFDISLQKIETWLYKWIKFSTPSSDILTYTQI
ncbi:hypothetical protein C2G38_2193640 [Gigaspora rosea]|uniref:Uncharacterized protein n=1 Tax=Gigaspora rosea TaxID=44941 RepID=A0A397V1Q4_9GLOM|nr:hypothetical protein C2G38_2193640 [Gigaspora rosea]